jgi:hypothetical protein
MVVVMRFGIEWVYCIGGSAFGTMVDFRFAAIPRPVPFHGPGVPSLRSGREKEIEPINVRLIV